MESLEEVDVTDLPRLQKYLMRFGDFRERIKKHARCFAGASAAQSYSETGINERMRRFHVYDLSHEQRPRQDAR